MTIMKKLRSVNMHGFISEPKLFKIAHDKINEIVPKNPVYNFQNELEIEDKIADLITFCNNVEYLQAMTFIMQLAQNTDCVSKDYNHLSCQSIIYNGLLCEICYNNYNMGFMERPQDDYCRAEYCGVCRHKILALEEERKINFCGVCMIVRVLESYNSLARIRHDKWFSKRNKNFNLVNTGQKHFVAVYLSVLRYYLNKAEGGYGLFTAN